MSCNSCHKWYHLRCTNTGNVLPGLLENDKKSNAVEGCESRESYCHYNKKTLIRCFP